METEAKRTATTRSTWLFITVWACKTRTVSVVKGNLWKFTSLHTNNETTTTCTVNKRCSAPDSRRDACCAIFPMNVPSRGCFSKVLVTFLPGKLFYVCCVWIQDQRCNNFKIIQWNYQSMKQNWRGCGLGNVLVFNMFGFWNLSSGPKIKVPDLSRNRTSLGRNAWPNPNNVNVCDRSVCENGPRWGDCHMKRTGMLVENFEFNP